MITFLIPSAFLWDLASRTPWGIFLDSKCAVSKLSHSWVWSRLWHIFVRISPFRPGRSAQGTRLQKASTGNWFHPWGSGSPQHLLASQTSFGRLASEAKNNQRVNGYYESMIDGSQSWKWKGHPSNTSPSKANVIMWHWQIHQRSKAQLPKAHWSPLASIQLAEDQEKVLEPSPTRGYRASGRWWDSLLCSTHLNIWIWMVSKEPDKWLVHGNFFQIWQTHTNTYIIQYILYLQYMSNIVRVKYSHCHKTNVIIITYFRCLPTLTLEWEHRNRIAGNCPGAVEALPGCVAA